MNRKDFVIIGLLFLLAVNAARADVPIGVNRADLFEAAAICGILANSHIDPSGWNGFGIGKFMDADRIMSTAQQYRKLGENAR